MSHLSTPLEFVDFGDENYMELLEVPKQMDYEIGASKHDLVALYTLSLKVLGAVF